MQNQTSSQGETIVMVNNTIQQKCPFCDEQLTFVAKGVTSEDLEGGRTKMDINFESAPESTEHVYRHEEDFKNFPQRYIPLASDAAVELAKAGLPEADLKPALRNIDSMVNDLEGQRLVQNIHDRKNGASK
ncbi:hypothetical protein QEH68_06650 [Paenarthrobacter sp. OM7]|uniref:hypothetical protein n=1 Tax=Paenarthrobacter sp. OM7 TaxID=3041264 RepID=UPI002468BF8D|nr:hypothetical protein [Paenarthrobacter sp. OM7]WGM21847.1 hypothetical protein QEH68_06650 [Paenarthrobacter sp. OM7]